VPEGEGPSSSAIPASIGPSGVESERPGPSRAHGARRVLAVVLPELALELAEAQLELELRMSAASGGDTARGARAVPLSAPVAVVLSPEGERRAVERLHADAVDAFAIEPSLHAVNNLAATLGVHRGQALGSALATLRGLVVVAVPVTSLVEEVARLSDLLRRHAGLVTYEAPDTIWLELPAPDRRAVDGTLAEALLAEEVLRSFTALGHRASVAVADGPWLARSFASFGELERSGTRVVSSAATEEALIALPVIALPLAARARIELARQGALTIADLRAMPSSALVEGLLRRDVERSRRGRRRPVRAVVEPFPQRSGSPRELLDLVRGRDRTVLQSRPAPALREEAQWPRATSSAAALDLALARSCTRLGARLAGRQEAAAELALFVSTGSSEARRLTLRPRAPVWSSDELLAAAHARLREVASEPVLALALEVVRVAPMRPPQGSLAFAQPGTEPVAAEAVTSLLRELEQRIGATALGFAPAGQQRGGVLPARELPMLSNPSGSAWSRGVPTRWLNPPQPLAGSLGKDQIVVLGAQAYVIRARHFEGRSTSAGESRDYFRLWLAALDEGSSEGVTAGVARRGVEVLVYRDRRGAHLQAFFD
jgi:protein ImuB